MLKVGEQALQFEEERNHFDYEYCKVHWENFLFQVSLNIAHEIVHFFTGYLTGNKEDDTETPYTPPAVTWRYYGEDGRGEAGWFWEGNVFGGTIEHLADPDNPLGFLQAGTPFLRREDGTSQYVAHTYIRRILNLDVHTPDAFPAATIGKVFRDEELFIRYELTSDLRNRALFRGRPAPHLTEEFPKPRVVKR